VGFYYAGSKVRRFRGPVDIALGVVAVVAIVVFLMWTRRHAKRLEQEAELAYPGPLDDDAGTTGGSAPEAA
jgi:hypothetical protein